MSVSIIIKTLNEEKRIAEAVESALKALPGGKVEVIVADSGSTDRTIAIAQSYPIKIVQIEPPARASCGLGPQLGFQYSTQPYICLIDGDMIIEPDFLPAALDYLGKHPEVGGVTGHVVDQILESLEFQRRAKRYSPEARTGDIDRMNGGGLYRRSAIEQAGYFSDRNLHGHEEFDAGVRLRSNGWKLYRLDRPFVQHFGYTMNAYKLLVRRWKSKYLRGTGEVLRAAMGQPHQKNLFRELPELRLWGAVYLWWLAILAALIFVPGWPLAVLAATVIAVVPFAAMSIRSHSIELGIYAVVAWIFHAAALPLGFFQARRKPTDWIESKVIREP
ncbi:glycosyltransferase [Brucella cytisi]|uniref:Glycosyl transferase n=1 Tax=Brucella cytisi TaxID=407152 RepID=A0A1J6I357_9HYPH|nr:glycosyltransferase [Brucella cytisi]OIS93314.1 glycosyl transferase [Brucella cytisi]